MKKRKIFKILLIVAWVLASPFVFIGVIKAIDAISDRKVPQTDEYKEYRCYDYHLRTDQASDTFGRYIPNEAENDTFYYSKITGESPKEFLYVGIDATGMHKPFEYYVFQNPDNYVPIRSDWTVKELQILDNSSMHTVLYSTNDTDLIAEFGEFINSEHKETEDISEEPYKSQIIKVKLLFWESEHIFWETQVRVRDFEDKRTISVDIGSDVDIYGNRSRAKCYIEVTPDSDLYNMFSLRVAKSYR